MTDSWGSRRIARSVVMEMVRELEAQIASRSVINMMTEEAWRKIKIKTKPDTSLLDKDN